MRNRNKNLAKIGFKTYISGMEQFLNEVRAFARQAKIKPATVVQNGAGLSGTTWEKWENGTSFPRIDTIDKIRSYMAKRSPQKTESAA